MRLVPQLCCDGHVQHVLLHVLLLVFLLVCAFGLGDVFGEDASGPTAEPMQAVRGAHCERDASTCCGIASSVRRGASAANGATTGPPTEAQAPTAGQNFGMPHRDFTCLQSLAPDGAPLVLSVWLPLTEVTTDNGCMMAVPRALDPAAVQPAAPSAAPPAAFSAVALAIALGFLGLLRPSEMLQLKWHDIMLPAMTLPYSNAMFLLLHNTKASTRGAKHQHVASTTRS